METKDIVALIHKLYESVERRKEEYLRVMSLETTNAESKISFTARACECDGILIDLGMLLERVEQ